MKSTYFARQKESLVASFASLGTRAFWKAFVLDTMCIILVLITWTLSSLIISSAASDVMPTVLEMNLAKQSGDEQLFEQLSTELEPQMKDLLWTVSLAWLSTFVLIVFFISWLSGQAWAIMMRAKFGLRYINKLFWLSLGWYSIWLIVMFILALTFKPNYESVNWPQTILVLLAAYVFMYSDGLLRAYFAEAKKLKDVLLVLVKNMFKIHEFVAYISVLVVIFMLLMFMINLLPSEWLLLQAVSVLLSLSVIVGWSRSYILSISRRIA